MSKYTSIGNGITADYDYDFERKRLSKTVSGDRRDYVYAGNQVINEYLADNLNASYGIGSGEVVKSDFAGEGSRNYFSDALGSVTSLADDSSSLISRNDYDSFGEIVSSTGLTQNAVTYTGQRLDVESGLMALGNGERYYNPSYGRFIQQDSYAGMPDMPQSLNRFSYGHNNPNKYVDPSGNEGVIADQMRSKVQNGIANTGNETADWWINFGANFVTGFAYDAANTSTGGLLGTADVMAQDVMNGKMPDPVSAWQRGGYSATQSQIYTNFAYYSAGAVKGVGNLAYGIATGVPTLAYGLATDFNGTINNMWLGLADKTASVIDTALNPRKALDDLAQHSQEDIAFGLGEVVGEAALGVYTGGKALKYLSKTKYGSKIANKLDNFKGKANDRLNPRNYDFKLSDKIFGNGIGGIDIKYRRPKNPTNAHLQDLPINYKQNRFYVKADELLNKKNLKPLHPINNKQLEGHPSVGHKGVENLSDEDLLKFGGPRGDDPIRGFREFGAGDDIRNPGSQIHIRGGHHRLEEIKERVRDGKIKPETLIEFLISRE